MAWGGPSGGRPSSTRAEALAVLAALGVDKPVVVALDSSNAHRRFQWILKAPRPHRFCWSLARDGDIWALVDAALRARGGAAESIKIK
eukprot:14281626-Alexandrium_andersonii.AAC.1